MQAWLTVALASVSTAMAFADGELDLGFAPPPDLGTNFITSFAVIAGRAYFSAPGFPVSRLREDGGLDEGWQLTYPFSGANAIHGLPSGGLAVADYLSLLVQYSDGSYVRPVGGGVSLPYVGSLLPQEDGAITVISNSGAHKFGPDGIVDPVFGIGLSLPNPGSFPLRGINDSKGRYVIAGDFRTTAPPDRSGAVRLLPDGSLDPNWNPNPELTEDLDANGILDVLAIAALPEDSVLLVLPQELVWINADGEVTKRIPNLAGGSSFAPPMVQPDGKIILGGNRFKWGGPQILGLIRLNADGTPDPSFDVQLDTPVVLGASLDSQGRLWMTGSFHAVNGVARPGIARLQAYTPVPADNVPLHASITAAPRHVATNEALYLTAQVDGLPEPTLQWLRDGTPIAGATNRGLRLSITNGSELGAFTLVLSNASGLLTLDFPTATLAARSPRPGTEDLAFNRALTNFNYVNQLIPLSDGRILVGNGTIFENYAAETPLVGRLLPDGGPDSSFGRGGLVKGRGHVETLVPLPGGGLLVTGDFTELVEQPAQGLAELDRSGNLVARPFPSLDIARVTAALPLPDGKLLIAGPFTKVGGAPAFRLARLNADLTLDTSFHSPLLAWQLVDQLALDSHGRVLMVGGRPYSDVVVTDPPLVGLQRLLADGSPDPEFQARTEPLRSVFVEPGGTLLTGMPAMRLDEDGNVLTVFDDSRYSDSISDLDFSLLSQPNHLMIRTSGGGVIYRAMLSPGNHLDLALWRWKPTGERDLNFQSEILSGEARSPYVTAMAILPDDAVLFSVLSVGTADDQPTPEQARRLRRILPDSDLSLRVKDVSAGQFHFSLATQPGLSYEIYQRDQLTGGTPTKLGDYSGDGYVIDLEVPASGNAGYLELRRH